MGQTGSCTALACNASACQGSQSNTGANKDPPAQCVSGDRSRKDKEEETINWKSACDAGGACGRSAEDQVHLEECSTAGGTGTSPTKLEDVGGSTADSTGAAGNDQGAPRYEELHEQDPAANDAHGTPITSRDTVGMDELDAYAKTLAERLSRGHSSIAAIVVNFLQSQRDLAVDAEVKSSFWPFVCRVDGVDDDEIERVVIDLAVQRQQQGLLVTSKSSCVRVRGEDARVEIAEQALRPNQPYSACNSAKATETEDKKESAHGQTDVAPTLLTSASDEGQGKCASEPGVDPKIEASNQGDDEANDQYDSLVVEVSEKKVVPVQIDEQQKDKAEDGDDDDEAPKRCCICFKRPKRPPQDDGSRCARGTVAPISLGQGGEEQVSLEDYLKKVEERQLNGDGSSPNPGFSV